MRRNPVKILLLAAALSLSAGAAYANEGGAVPNTLFTELPGVVAQAPSQSAPSVATGQNGQVRLYSTQSSRGTWLFPPREGNG